MTELQIAANRVKHARLAPAKWRLRRHVRRLKVCKRLLVESFIRDTTAAYIDASCFLDRDTGKILWLYGSDRQCEMAGVSAQANRRTRMRLERSQSRFIAIPKLTQGLTDKMLKTFIESEWTENWDQQAFARLAYDGSVFHWKKRVPRETRLAFNAYEIRFLTPTMEGFLLAHGIEPRWL